MSIPDILQLSGGQERRVALAIHPALLLADEPTENLDIASADAGFARLRRVYREQNTAVLFATHTPLLAARCDRTIDGIDGRAVPRDST